MRYRKLSKVLQRQLAFVNWLALSYLLPRHVMGREKLLPFENMRILNKPLHSQTNVKFVNLLQNHAVSRLYLLMNNEAMFLSP